MWRRKEDELGLKYGFIFVMVIFGNFECDWLKMQMNGGCFKIGKKYNLC